MIFEIFCWLKMGKNKPSLHFFSHSDNIHYSLTYMLSSIFGQIIVFVCSNYVGFNMI